MFFFFFLHLNLYSLFLQDPFFIFRNSIKTDPFDFKNNDTISHLQKFYSHFAYDDGSAESAYGINVQGAKLAYEFKLNRPDTLRIVQMKFVEMHEDLTNNQFVLTIWGNNNGYMIFCFIIFHINSYHNIRNYFI